MGPGLVCACPTLARFLDIVIAASVYISYVACVPNKAVKSKIKKTYFAVASEKFRHRKFLLVVFWRHQPKVNKSWKFSTTGGASQVSPAGNELKKIILLS